MTVSLFYSYFFFGGGAGGGSGLTGGAGGFGVTPCVTPVIVRARFCPPGGGVGSLAVIYSAVFSLISLKNSTISTSEAGIKMAETPGIIYLTPWRQVYNPLLFPCVELV